MENYLLNANIAIALFYLAYRTLLHKDTHFRWRRATLMGILAASAALPLLDLQGWFEVMPAGSPMAAFYTALPLPVTAGTPQATAGSTGTVAHSLFFFAYWGIVAVLSMRLLLQLGALFRMARRCPESRINGTAVRLLPQNDSPFSFFQWIFVHPGSHTREALDEILMHEQAHARQRHSADVLLSEVACILCWFNPFAWLVRREVRLNLEYLADAQVLENGCNPRSYQYNLLKLSYPKAAANLYNQFNVLPLKKRITMMNKKRTSNIGKAKYLMFIPVAALLALLCNAEALAKATPQNTASVQAAPSGQDKAQVYDIVEEMPEFPGGQEALKKFLAENLKTPANLPKGTHRVIVRFTVQRDGTIADAKVTNPDSKYQKAEQEALRIIKLMPKWKPGKQDGKAVAVRYTVPFAFTAQ